MPPEGAPAPARARDSASASPVPSPASVAGAAAEGDPADAFTPFARALGIEVPPRAPDAALPTPEDEAELLLAEAVLAHFRRNRPGPASAPSLSLRVLNLVASPHVEVGEMVKLVSADPALSAGLLTVANSTYYRGLEEIETVRAAVVRLGLEEVARVAGALSAKSLFNPRLKLELQRYAPRFQALYHRALTAANGAAWIALQQRGGRSDRAFLAGMLHDVGKSIALRSLAALQLEGADAPPPARVERVLDRVHVEIGAECHQEWQLPQYLTVAAVRHHDLEIPGEAEFVDLHATRLASALLDLRDLREAPLLRRAADEVVQSAAALGLSPFRVRSADAELRDAGLRVASSFGVEKSPGAS